MYNKVNICSRRSNGTDHLIQQALETVLCIDKKVSEEVTLTVLHKSCSTLEVDIADMTEFTEGEIKWVL